MSAEPVWLLREFIIAVHERLIAEYGGSSGLRDEGLLESALARPMHLFTYGKPSRAQLAASNAVIELASERFTKNLWTDRAAGELPYLVSVPDEADQARYVVERVLENRESGALRTASPSRSSTRSAYRTRSVSPVGAHSVYVASGASSAVTAPVRVTPA